MVSAWYALQTIGFNLIIGNNNTDEVINFNEAKGLPCTYLILYCSSFLH